MKLDIGFNFVEEGSATIEINDSDYLDWAHSRSYNSNKTDEDMLADVGLIRIYLEFGLSVERVSEMVDWNKEITDIWDVDIIE